MSKKYKFDDNDKLYFVSLAVTNWIDLFIREIYREEISKSIRYCQTNKGIEIYPKKSYSWFAKWVIGASHHSLHHTRFNYNFGLFFTVWDRWLHTESDGFEEVFKGEINSGIK